MRYCQNQQQTGIELRTSRFLESLLPAARLGACCFLRGIFLFNDCVFGAAGRCRGQVKSECGLRRSAHGHTRRLCVRAGARACAQVFILALGVVRSLGLLKGGKKSTWNGAQDGKQRENGAALLAPPAGGESAPLTIRFRPSAPRTLIDACQSVPQAAATAGPSAGAIRGKRGSFRRCFGGSARCGRPGRGDASRHRSIEQTEH